MNFQTLYSSSFIFPWKKALITILGLGLVVNVFNFTPVFAFSYPPEVQNVKAITNNDGSVTLKWDELSDYTDDVIVDFKIYHDVKTVQTAEDSYATDFNTRSTKTEYTVKNLEMGVRYYFAVTALNSAGLESATYSKEVSVIPRKKDPVSLIEDPVVEDPIVEPVIEDPVVEDPVIEPPVENNPPVEETKNNQSNNDANNTAHANNNAAQNNVAPDMTPPLEATSIHVDTSMAKQSNKVVINWTKSLDVDNDVSDQVIYTRTGLGNWDAGYSVGPRIETLELDVEPNQNYEIRLVTVDESGNETRGVNYKFSTYLSESGPNTHLSVIALVLIFFALMIAGLRKRQI